MITKKIAFSLLILALISYLFFDHSFIRFTLSPLEKKGCKLLSFLLSPGLHALFWPIFFLYRLLRKKGWLTCAICTSVGFGTIFARLLKFGVGRARPAHFFSLEAANFKPFTLSNTYHSFPSGHAVIAMAICTTLSAYYPRKAPLFLVLGVSLPLCRLFLGKHYLCDILAGEALGILIALFCMGKVSLFFHSTFQKILGVKHDRAPTL